MAWLRLYDTILDNRKFQKLPDPLVKPLINFWAVAKRHGGVIPSVGDAAYDMRLQEKVVLSLLNQLIEREFIDRLPNGMFQPHDWDEHQYLSDDSKPRVKKHRQKRRKPVTSAVTSRVSNGDCNGDGNGLGNGVSNGIGNGPKSLPVTAKIGPEQIDTEQSRAEQSRGSGVTTQPYSQPDNHLILNQVSAREEMPVDMSSEPGFCLEGNPVPDNAEPELTIEQKQAQIAERVKKYVNAKHRKLPGDQV